MEKGTKKGTSYSYSYLPTTDPDVGDYSSEHQKPSRSRDPSPSKSARKKPFGGSTYWSYLSLRNCLIFIAAFANLLISIWVVIEHGNLPELFPGEHDLLGRKSDEGKKCHLPELNAFSPEMKAVIFEPTKIDCKKAANVDFAGRTFFKVENDVKQRLIRTAHPGIPCCYRPFSRVNDAEVWIEPTRARGYVCHNITEAIIIIPDQFEFVELICSDTVIDYKDAFAFVRRKNEVEERVAKQKEQERELDPHGPKPERLSVIILGIDSTSQQNFIREMPRSVEFLKNTLGATRLDGYVKVADNTLPNLVPLLTGMDLDDFKKQCVMKYPPMESAVHLDDCPFIWKWFEDNGYRTAFAEDDVSMGIFNMYWSHAFLNPPTDHYFRPYSLRMTTAQNVYDGFCFGPRMGFQVLLDYLTKAGNTYKDKDDLLFHLTWASKLTHDDFNRLGWIDNDFRSTLQALHQNGKLNNSALFILSDHGSRKSELRAIRQGQLEDRLPLAYVVLPPWFTHKYPTAAKNLQQNAKLITSAYDIHETFKDFMDLGKLNDAHTHYLRQRKLKVAEKKGHRQGTSLFSPLPETRGCVTAGIPPHWCICYKKRKIAIKSLDVHDAVGFVLRELNSQLRPYRDICSTLKLRKVVTALKWQSEEMIENTYHGNSEESYKKATLLEITFMASPSDALFEVTVIFDPEHGWKFTEQVVRIDRYEGHSRCMPLQDLKKICMCIDPDAPPKPIDLLGHDFPIF